MNIKFPNNFDIDYVRIVIGEDTTTVNEETYMLFSGYRKGQHFNKDKTWMKARVPFRFTVNRTNDKRPLQSICIIIMPTAS